MSKHDDVIDLYGEDCIASSATLACYCMARFPSPPSRLALEGCVCICCKDTIYWKAKIFHYDCEACSIYLKVLGGVLVFFLFWFFFSFPILKDIVVTKCLLSSQHGDVTYCGLRASSLCEGYVKNTSLFQTLIYFFLKTQCI